MSTYVDLSCDVSFFDNLKGLLLAELRQKAETTVAKLEFYGKQISRCHMHWSSLSAPEASRNVPWRYFECLGVWPPVHLNITRIVFCSP
jgi:hypothetical protein